MSDAVKFPKPPKRVRDPEYMRWVKTLPCCAPVGKSRCRGVVEAHHAGERAYSRKADDNTCIPLCWLHHHDWHAGQGPFIRWRKAWRRKWADERIAETQALYEQRGEVEVVW